MKSLFVLHLISFYVLKLGLTAFVRRTKTATDSAQKYDFSALTGKIIFFVYRIRFFFHRLYDVQSAFVSFSEKFSGFFKRATEIKYSLSMEKGEIASVFEEI